MTSLTEQLYDEILNALATEGSRILRECVDERDYNHRTMNLHDSYGFGVYLKGSLKRSGFLTSMPKATIKKHGLSGREEIENFLNGVYQPSNGIDMVIAAAMPYASDLEFGVGLRRQYRVITMSTQKLKTLAAKNNCGTVQQILFSKRK